MLRGSRVLLLWLCCVGGFRQAVTAGADLVITPAKDVIVADGASLTIQCIFAAGTAVPIDISFNGKFLTESNLAQNSTLHHDSGNSTLAISSFTVVHSGTYYCRYRTFLSPYTSSSISALLAVAPVIEKSDALVLVNVSQPWTLACRSSGLPTPNLTFVRGSEVIAQEDGVSSLTVLQEPARETDGQQYACLAQNMAGVDVFNFNVVVQTPALIVASSYASTLVSVRDGGRLALSCDARGVPRPTIAWMHNSSFAMPSANFSTRNLTDNVTRSILTVQRVSLNDSGVYSCHASNALGQDSTIQTVIVQVRPSAPRTISITDIDQYSATVRWLAPEFNGYSVITQFLVKLDSVFSSAPLLLRADGRSSSLQLFGLEANSIYTVHAVAMNAIGPGSLSEYVNFTTLPLAPPAPLNLALVSVDATSAVLNWTIPTVWTPQQGVLRHFSLVIQGRMSIPNISLSDLPYRVTGLVRASTFRISVLAHNRAFSSSLDAAVVSVTTPATAPTPPRWSDAVGVSSRSVRLLWDPPADTGGLARTHYILMYVVDSTTTRVLTLNADVTTHTVSALQPNTSYAFSLVAVNAMGKSDKAEMSAMTLLPNRELLPTPPPPQVLYRSNGSVYIAYPEIESVGSATHWMLQHRQTGGVTWVQQTSLITVQTECVPLMMTSGERSFEVRLALSSSTDRSFFSSSIMTETLSPGYLPDVSVIETSDGSITVRRPSCGIQQDVVVEYRLSTSSEWQRVATSSRDSITIQGLTERTSYLLRFVSVDANDLVVSSSLVSNISTHAVPVTAKGGVGIGVIIAVAVSVPILLILVAALLTVVFAPRKNERVILSSKQFRFSTAKSSEQDLMRHDVARLPSANTNRISTNGVDAAYPVLPDDMDPDSYYAMYGVTRPANYSIVPVNGDPTHGQMAEVDYTPINRTEVKESNYAALEFVRSASGRAVPNAGVRSEYSIIDPTATRRAHETQVELHSTKIVSLPDERTHELEHSTV